MSIVVYKDSKGNLHEVVSGVPFKMQPDWVEVEVKASSEDRAFDDTLTKIAKAVGLSLDETITRLTKALGIKKCPACQLRSQILKEMGKLGWIETLRRLKATFKKDT